jgi:hypothetical protein
MIWQEWITSVANAINIDVATTALLLSLVFTISLVLTALLATRGKSNMGVLIIGYASILFFTVLGWMPYFILLLLVLITAGLYAGWFRDVFTRGGGNQPQQ